jgi:hypothetical protein
MDASMRVPRLTSDCTDNAPPTLRTRSAMLTSPNPVLHSTEVAAKPRPESDTHNKIESDLAANSTRTRRLPLCFSTFRIASCATR